MEKLSVYAGCGLAILLKSIVPFREVVTQGSRRVGLRMRAPLLTALMCFISLRMGRRLAWFIMHGKAFDHLGRIKLALGNPRRACRGSLLC